jgi:hypothetical protein
VQRIVAALSALLVASPLTLASPQQPRLDITLPAPDALSRDGPSVRAVDVISDDATRGLLESGFPTRLHFRVELWSSGRVFDQLRDSREWDVFVYYDALGTRYRLVRVEGAGDVVTSVGQFSAFADMVREVERASTVPLRPRPQRDRQYFIAVLDVETLSVSDLDEVGRWLRGEMQPAVSGRGNPGTALGRGLRRLFVRLLGAERRNLQARTPTFLVGG